MNSVKKILLNEKFEINDNSGKLTPFIENYFRYFENFKGKGKFNFRIEFDNEFYIFYQKKEIFSSENPLLIINFLDFFIKENIFPLFNNFLILHGSCVSDGKNTFLISGRAGSGKSTLSLLLSKKDFFYMGDDITPVDYRHKNFYAGSYPQPAGIHKDLKRFVDNENFIEDKEVQKIFVFPWKILNNSFLPLKRIIFPVPSRLNKIERMKKSITFLYLSAVSLNSPDYMKLKGLDFIEEIVDTVPAYKIFWNSFEFLTQKACEILIGF